MAIGSKSYPLTSAEEMCLEQGRKAIADYEDRVKTGWEKMLKRLDAQQVKPAAPSSPAKVAPAAEPMQPKPFEGGVMVFFDDRVEFCSVSICSGRRSQTRRKVLELLSTRRSKGKFESFSGD